MSNDVKETKVTHRQALEAIKVLGKYCDTHSCFVDCILCEIEHCNVCTLSDNILIVAKETERLEREEKHKE